MKVIDIIGARPQFIKLAAIHRAIGQQNQRFRPSSATDGLEPVTQLIVHTGQHYDYDLSKVFFEELEIPEPDYNLGVGSGTHAEQTGEMLKRLGPVLRGEWPDAVLVYGDTNSTLAGALAAAKLHIPVAHVEAGLRSFNRKMPEEINRVVTDHLADLLLCPTEEAVRNLEREGFTNVAAEGRLLPLQDAELHMEGPSDKPLVINVGDVMYDSVLRNVKLAEARSEVLERLSLIREGYYLATVHRAENTDDPSRLREIFAALEEVAQRGTAVICPLHPRTRKALLGLGHTEWHSRLRLIDPVSYLDMLLLEKNASLIMTDSGGVQKEAFILRKPCITLRDETEWTETTQTGWNTLTGADRGRILAAVEKYARQRPRGPEVDPYGDGRAAERILGALLGRIG